MIVSGKSLKKALSSGKNKSCMPCLQDKKGPYFTCKFDVEKGFLKNKNGDPLWKSSCKGGFTVSLARLLVILGVILTFCMAIKIKLALFCKKK